MSVITVVYPYGVEDPEAEDFLKSLASITVGLLGKALDSDTVPTIRSVKHRASGSLLEATVLTVEVPFVEGQYNPADAVGVYVPAGKDVPTGHRLLAKWLKELGYTGLTHHKRTANELKPGGFNSGTVAWVRPAHLDYVKQTSDTKRRSYPIRLAS